MKLFIDTHLNDIVILLVDNNKIIKKEIVSNVKKTSTMIMPTIVNVIGENKLSLIIVVNGPGSFTGVRLGVTIAKTLAHTLNIPIKTVTSLEQMAVSLEESDKIVAFSDKNGYYVGIFNSDNNLIGEYEYLSNSEYEIYSSKYEIITNVAINYEKVIEFADKKDSITPHKVNPIYIKKLDVEK